MNPFINCPSVTTKNFTFCLVSEADTDGLFECYNDKTAVSLMNDDNCDFGFYVDSKERMAQTIKYWVNFYNEHCFIRFSVVDNHTGRAVGTLEGFGGETGVLRIDLATEYEKTEYIDEILDYVGKNFGEYFGNTYLVTKAVPAAAKRREALLKNGWEFIDRFRDYSDYFQKKI